MPGLKTKLKLEALNSRIVPTTIALPAPPVCGCTPAIVQQKHALTGLGVGTFTSGRINANAGLTVCIGGQCTVADMGAVNVTGSLTGVGRVAKGYACGTLTFSNSKGSVTVQLTGLNEQTCLAPPPNFYRYKVVSATGQYRAMKDTGTLRIDLQAIACPVGQTPRGNFRIAI